MNNNKNKMAKKGFTLIELLTVIAIIGILATIITVSTNSARIQSRDAKRKADLNSISAALEMMYAQQKAYPLTLNLLVPNYISSVPLDPKAGQYEYKLNPTTKKQYVIVSQLEGKETQEFTCTEDTNSLDYYRTGVCCEIGTAGKCYFRVTNK